MGQDQEHINDVDQARYYQGCQEPFADFIRNAKSEQKKRVYSEVLAEATTKQQNLVMLEAEAKRG